MFPGALSQLILPTAQSGNCHNILTFKTIMGMILVSQLLSFFFLNKNKPHKTKTQAGSGV